MIRRAWMGLVLLALAACEAGLPLPRPVADAACRWRPDGGPPLADRGIGGTGRTAGFADRGIGGTGIGTSGIFGTVAGFASICVDGIEVGYDPAVPVEIDGMAATSDALRVGQSVAIVAARGPAMPRAVRVSVRYEVSGPVEAVENAGEGRIVVAGQRVRVLRTTVGDAAVRPGAWVAVSGLRGADGDIVASRIDPRLPGLVTVHGPLIAADGTRWIGALAIRGDGQSGEPTDTGQYVAASGLYADGVLQVSALAPDLLASDPPSFFGPGTDRVTVAAYVRFGGGVARIGGGFEAPLAPGFVAPSRIDGPAAISLALQSDRTFAVTAVAALPRMSVGLASVTAGARGLAPSEAIRPPGPVPDPVPAAEPAGGASGNAILPRPAIVPAPPLPVGAGLARPLAGAAFGGLAIPSAPAPAGPAAARPLPLRVRK